VTSAPQPSTPGAAQVPEASFLNFLSGLGSQGLIQVGALPHPVTGERAVNLPYARYTVQVLTILRDKTDGHRTPEEDHYLSAMIGDLTARIAKLEQ
jgi:hypothetical protein